MKKLILFLALITGVVSYSFGIENKQGYNIATSSNHGTFVHQVEYSNYVSVNSSNTGQSAQVDFLTSSVNVNNIAIGLIQTSVNVNNIQIGILGTSVTAVNNYQVVTATNSIELDFQKSTTTILNKWVVDNSTNMISFNIVTSSVAILNNYQLVTATNSIELDFQKSTTTVLNNFVLVTSSNSAQINKLTDFMVVNDTTVVQVETNRQSITTIGVSTHQWTRDSANTNIWNRNTGKVGIGTTAPTAKLDVSGLIVSTSLIVNGVIINTNGGAGGASVAGSTFSITVYGGGFTTISSSGAYNYRDEFTIGGLIIPNDYTVYHELLINSAFKTLYAPNYLDDSGGYTINLIWVSTQTANECIWEIGISTMQNFLTDNYVVYSATTTVSAIAQNINTSPFQVPAQGIVPGQMFKIRLRRIADSADDDMAGNANVASLNIQGKRLW